MEVDPAVTLSPILNGHWSSAPRIAARTSKTTARDPYILLPWGRIRRSIGHGCRFYVRIRSGWEVDHEREVLGMELRQRGDALVVGATGHDGRHSCLERKWDQNNNVEDGMEESRS
jgi:hypothetical protein